MEKKLDFCAYVLKCFIVVVPLTFMVGAYFAIKLKFLPLRALPLALKLSTSSSLNQGKFSSFSALAAVLGGNLGVGNISGMAIALAMGGPGSLLWMWVMAIFGSMLKLASCFLGILYRKKAGVGYYVGGPMYYIKQGLKAPRMAMVFSGITVFAALTVGNLAQVNSFSLTVEPYCHPLFAGLVMAGIVGIIILGDIKHFASFSAFIVPLMASLYVIMCVIVLFRYNEHILSAFKLIFMAAFDLKAATAGAGGYALLHVMQVGFNRGLFATDAGAGLEAIVHASVTTGEADHQSAISQALIASVAPFIVVALCTITGLVLLVTGVWDSQTLKSTSMCVAAFQQGLNFEHAHLLLMVIVFFFALTTILTWSFCFDRALEYVIGRPSKIAKLVFLCAIPLGAVAKVDMVWTLGDIAFNAMLLVNVMCVARLSRHVIEGFKPYLCHKKRKGLAAMVVVS